MLQQLSGAGDGDYLLGSIAPVGSAGNEMHGVGAGAGGAVLWRKSRSSVAIVKAPSVAAAFLALVLELVVIGSTVDDGEQSLRLIADAMGVAATVSTENPHILCCRIGYPTRNHKATIRK